MASIRKRNNGYEVRWRERQGDRWTWRSRACRTLAAARQLKRRIERAVDLHGYWEQPARPEPVEDRPDPDLGQLTDAYLIAQKAAGKADNTILRYGQALEVFTRWARSTHRGQLLTGDVFSESTLTRFYVWLGRGTGRHGRPRSAGTKRKYLQVILNVWSWLSVKDEWHEFVSPRVPQLRHMDVAPAVRTRTLAPTWAEMDACITCASGPQRQLYTVLRHTGLRVQQAMELLWSDLDLHNAVLHVRPELGKTAQEKQGRWIPITPHLVTEVAGWGRREGYLIESHRQPGLKGRSARLARSRDARRAWDRAIETYGVRPAVTKQPHHSFRKGFNSGLKKLGADDEAVEVLLGHSLGLRGVYTDPDSLPLREAVALIPPVGRSMPVERGLVRLGGGRSS